MAALNERRWAKLADIRTIVDAEQRSMVGTAAVFESWNDPLLGIDEQIVKGAFTDALRDADTRALFNHDSNLILGRTTSNLLANGKHTLELRETNLGLEFEIYPPRTYYADGLEESVSRGDVREASFQFTIAENGDDWVMGDDGRIKRFIKKIDRLLDISPVTFPAYPETSVGLRSAIQSSGIDLDAVRRAIAMRVTGGTIEDADNEQFRRLSGVLDLLLGGRPAQAAEQSEADELKIMICRHALARSR